MRLDVSTETSNGNQTTKPSSGVIEEGVGLEVGGRCVTGGGKH